MKGVSYAADGVASSFLAAMCRRVRRHDGELTLTVTLSRRAAGAGKAEPSIAAFRPFAPGGAKGKTSGEATVEIRMRRLNRVEASGYAERRMLEEL